MDRRFLRVATKLGESAHADLSHGAGVDEEAHAKDFIDFYAEHLDSVATEFSKVRKELIKKYPNLG